MTAIFDALMERVSHVWAYFAGVTTAILGGITAQDVAIWSGIFTTFGTFFINWYYKAKAAKHGEQS